MKLTLMNEVLKIFLLDRILTEKMDVKKKIKISLNITIFEIEQQFFF